MLMLPLLRWEFWELSSFMDLSKTNGIYECLCAENVSRAGFKTSQHCAVSAQRVCSCVCWREGADRKPKQGIKRL